MNGHQNVMFSHLIGALKSPRNLNGYGADYAASLDPKTARLALESILDIITETLADGEEIRIRGFGRMQRRKLHSRKYYHFSTKEMRISREKPVVVFKPSSRLISQHKQIVDSSIHIKTISELGFVPQSNSVFYCRNSTFINN